MASRYHWLQLGLSGAYSGVGSSQTLLDQTATIPAGGTLKKIVCSNTYVALAQTGSGYQAIQPFSINSQLFISSGPNNGRILRNQKNAMQMNAVAMDDIAPAFRYTAYHIAGDIEAGFNIETAYGKSSDVASWNVRWICSLQASIASYQSNVAGWRDLFMRLLYYK